MSKVKYAGIKSWYVIAIEGLLEIKTPNGIHRARWPSRLARLAFNCMRHENNLRNPWEC